MMGTNSRIIEPNATARIPPKRNFVVVDRERGDDGCWVKSFYKAEGPVFAYFGGVHHWVEAGGVDRGNNGRGGEKRLNCHVRKFEFELGSRDRVTDILFS
jgi:hypothetical protein